MHKVFISYHHRLDQQYKNELLRVNSIYQVFLDGSVDTGGIGDGLSDQTIRQKIRDEYLRDTTVTIVLVGQETKGRKHIDWEIYSSMIDGAKNKKSGVLAVNLPSTGNNLCWTCHDQEQELIYPEISSWINLETKAALQSRYSNMPDRLIDNIYSGTAKISVVPWSKFIDPQNMEFLIAATAQDRIGCEYDLSREMRKANSPEFS